MKNICFIGLLLFSVSCGKYAQENKLPNIVIILADDLGYGDPSCYNSESKIPTPVIEQNGENIDYNQEITEGLLSRGFDYYFGDDVPNFAPYTFIENKKVCKIPTIDKPNSLFGGKGKMAEGWTLESVMPEITQKSVEYINRASKNKKPFFLYFALTASHTPIAPATQFQGRSQAGRYGDFVYEVDWSVGQIMDTLKANSIDDNTLVIFTSDNGSPARNGKNWSGRTQSVVTDFGYNPNKNFRGMKGDIWEGDHSIPFIAKWTGRIAAGIKTPALAYSMDLMPTIAEIIAYYLPENASEDGTSLLSILTKGKNDGRKILVNHSHQGVFAIRKGEWKLILSNKSGGFSDSKYPEGFGIETPGQSYNLKNDPGEKENLYAKLPEKVEELTKVLEQIKNR